MEMWLEVDDAGSIFQPKPFYGIMEMWMELDDGGGLFQPKWFYGMMGS